MTGAKWELSSVEPRMREDKHMKRRIRNGTVLLRMGLAMAMVAMVIVGSAQRAELQAQEYPDSKCPSEWSCVPLSDYENRLAEKCVVRAGATKTVCTVSTILLVVPAVISAVVEEWTGIDICREAADTEFDKCMSGD
jgi:hypothetical protein